MSPATGDPTEFSYDAPPVPLVSPRPTQHEASETAEHDVTGPASSETRETTAPVAAAKIPANETVPQASLAERVGQTLDAWLPNRTLASAVAVAVSVELVLLGRGNVPVYRNGLAMAAVSVSFLIWFWLTLGLVLHRAARRFIHWRVQRGPTARRCATGAVSVLVAILALAYAISWGLFFQTNRFAHWEVINFALANPRDLWLYVTQAEPIHLVRAVAILLTLVVAVPLSVRRLANARSDSASQPFFRNRLWVWSTIVLILCGLRVVQDPSHRRRTENLGHLCHSLNPVATLTTSVLESVFSEPIRPVLNEQELIPRTAEWTPPPPSDTHPSIIIVAVESLRSDVIHQVHQGIEVTPHINRLAREGLQWKNAYSQSTHSDYADICIVSSLYPLRTRQHHYYTDNDPWPKVLIYDALKPAGYASAIISSQNEAWGGMENFLDTPCLDFFYHPQRSSETHLSILPERDLGFVHEIYTGHLKIGKFPDRHTADKAMAWIEARAREGKPFVLSMNLQSSHFPFAMPDDVPRPFQPCELDPDVMFMIYPENRTPKVRNAYFNAVHEADRQVGRLIAKLRELKLDDNVIVMVIGENGEAFHENNTVGHGREPFEPAIHVATVMWGPRFFQPRVEEYPLEHVDLLPTLFGVLGWTPHPNFQGIDALSPNRPALDERLLFFHTRSPSAFCDAVQYAGRWKYMWSFDYNNGTLCDLHADPTESKDLSDKYPELTRRLHDTLMQWRARQLAYYHFPAYYQNYFPPRPPTWNPERF